VHLWPEESRSGEVPASERVVEVTMKMAQLPSGPTPPQVCVFFRLIFSYVFRVYDLGNAKCLQWICRRNQEERQSKSHLRVCCT